MYVQGFCHFTRNCPNLSTILLEKTIFSDGDISSILQYCPNLRYLQLGEVDMYKGIFDEVLKRAAKYCPLLRTLNLTYRNKCNPEVIDHVLSSCSNIDKLVLGNNCEYSIVDPLLNARDVVTKEGRLHLADSLSQVFVVC